MSQTLGLTQRQEQRLDHQTRMELRQTLAQTTGRSIQDLLKDSNDSPEKLYDVMAARIQDILYAIHLDLCLQLLEQNKLADRPNMQEEAERQARDFARGVAERLLVPEAKTESLKRPTLHAIERSLEEYIRFHIDVLFKQTSGVFTFEDQSGLYKTIKADVSDAVLEPEKFDEAEKANKELLEMEARMHGSTEGLRRRLTEITAAKTVAEKLGPVLHNLAEIYHTQIIRVVDTIDEQEEPVFHSFFRDIVLHEHLSFIAAERLTSRFGQEIMKANNRKRQETVFMQAICEYTLASMGIISQGVLPKSRAKRTHESKEKYQERLRIYTKHADDEIVQEWKENQEKPALFLHHWQQKDAPSVTITTERKNAFLQQTVLANSKALLEIANFGDMLEQIEEIQEEYPEEEDQQVLIEEVLMNTLENDCVKTYLLQQIRGPWYSELNTFFEEARGEQVA